MEIPMFYSDIAWSILVLVGIIFLFSIFIFFFFFNRLKKLDKEHRITSITITRMQELFEQHFTVTDKTIIEERKEKQFWKERALKAERKRDEKKQ